MTLPAETACDMLLAAALLGVTDRARRHARECTPHVDDQAARYSTGDVRPVYFSSDDLARHTARTYHPGDERRVGEKAF